MAHDVFISHSSKDKGIGDAMCSILEQNRLRCWIAPRDVTPGKNYAACITDAIKQSRVMVVIFSEHSNTSGPVTNELELATKHGIMIIPFRVAEINPSDALDYYLSSKHWLDALTPPIEQHILKLAEVIKAYIKPIEPDNVPQEDERDFTPYFNESHAAESNVYGIQGRIHKSIEEILAPEEKVVMKGHANHFVGSEGVGGWLYLTSKRLAFLSHGLNFTPHEWIVPIEHINEAKPVRTLGLIPNGLEVVTRNGTSERFVVNGSKEWAANIKGLL